MEEFKERPFHYKIESLLLLLARECLDNYYYKHQAIVYLKLFKDFPELYANDFDVEGCPLTLELSKNYIKLIEDLILK